MRLLVGGYEMNRESDWWALYGALPRFTDR
jgi:hypothetical protein